MKKKWEYKSRIYPNKSIHEFNFAFEDSGAKAHRERDEAIATVHNDLGEEGWELVSHSPYNHTSSEATNSTMYTYKRPKD